jgi:hypothetical protein
MAAAQQAIADALEWLAALVAALSAALVSCARRAR